MVLVVGVPVLMLHALMRVLVLMCFREMQIDADRHKHARDDQLSRQRVPKHQHGEGRTNEWGAMNGAQEK